MESTKESITSRMSSADSAETLVAGNETSPAQARRKGLRLTKTTAAFILTGIWVGLSATVTAAAASSMFDGYTGVFEVANSVVAAATTIATPFLLRRISFLNSIILCAVVTMLSYLICALPDPMSKAKSTNDAGPIIGSMLVGFTHAFSQSITTSLAPYFPQEAVLALSSGMGLAVIIGPSTLIGLLAAFDQSWRRAMLVYIATGPLIFLVWYFLMDKECRDAAERSRIADQKPAAGETPAGRPSRVRLMFTKILPRLMPFLVLCITANLSTMGLAPALQKLGRFKDGPKGDLQFELIFLVSGIGNFLFSTLAGIWPRPHVWRWTALGVALCVVGVIQLVAPHFLPYYGVWVVVMFLIGADVGIGRTNCFYALDEEFKGDEYDAATHSFAMGFAGVGNFVGDAIGGGLAVMTEHLATKNLK